MPGSALPPTPANDHQPNIDPLVQLLTLASTFAPGEAAGATAAELDWHLKCALLAAMRLNVEAASAQNTGRGGGPLAP